MVPNRLMPQMYGSMMQTSIKQELGELCEIQEKRYRISRKVQWNSGPVHVPLNVPNPPMQSVKPEIDQSAYRFKVEEPQPKIWATNMLSCLEVSISSLIEDCKSTCEALNTELKETKEKHGKEVVGYQSKIDGLIVQRNALVLERDLANLETNAEVEKGEKSLIELEKHLETKHQQKLMKFDEDRNNELAQLRVEHVIELEKEKEQSLVQIENLKKEHSKMVADMENQIQVAVDIAKKDLENKYEKIVDRIKQTAELERSQLLEQSKGLTRCMCCGELLKVELYCNEQCGQMW